jgi:hypothetical protein
MRKIIKPKARPVEDGPQAEAKPAEPVKEQPVEQPKRGGAAFFVPAQKPSGFGVKGS